MWTNVSQLSSLFPLMFGLGVIENLEKFCLCLCLTEIPKIQEPEPIESVTGRNGGGGDQNPDQSKSEP